MKRFLIVIIVILLIPLNTLGDEPEAEYEDYLSAYDFSFFEEELGEETYSVLEELGIEDFSFDSITSISLSDVERVLEEMIKGGIKSPVKGFLSVLVIILLSALFQNLKTGEGEMAELYSTISALIISSLLIVEISPAITLSASSLAIAADFIYAFVPVFCAISAAGGGITTAFSTNSLLLMLSQGLSMLSAHVFMPIINCFLAISICAGLRSSLRLNKLIEGMKRGITSLISFTSGIFVSVLSIKTTVASRADILGIRSMRFVINSVVPIVGGSISEGLLSIQSYSSLIKSSVGIVGIIGVSFVFLPSILEMVLWRAVLWCCVLISDVFCDKSVSLVLNAFKDAVLLINVVLIVSMMTTIISIGVLVAARTA